MPTTRRRSQLVESTVRKIAANKESLLDRLTARLKFNKDDLDNELPEHADLVFQVGREFALSESARDGQNEKLKRLKPAMYERVGQALGPKAAQWKMDASLEEQPDWAEERDTYLRLKFETRRWEELKDAFSQRGYAMHNSAGLVTARIRAESGMSE